MAIASTNPATGQVVRAFQPMDAAVVQTRLERGSAAQQTWAGAPVAERVSLLVRLAGLLDIERDRLAELATLEMGKLLSAAKAEVQKCAATCRYYAAHLERFLAPEPVASQDHDGGRIEYQPLGLVLAIMPWNFPFWQVVRCAAPALAAGNAVLLKHASNVPQCALALEDVVARAGGPAGLLQALLLSADQVPSLIANRHVAAVSLTGSVMAGREVGAAAGRRLVPSVLELGGSDAFVVAPSANLELAVATAVQARIVNNGQSCIAAKRFIVTAPVYDSFVDGFVQRMRALRVGDPRQDSTDVGPLVSARSREQLDDQVRRSVAAGATLLCGGRVLPGAGFFYEPAVLGDVPASCPAWREELFGPVAPIRRATDVSDAIAMANDSEFGLGASAWTSDQAEAERLARELQAGTVFVNGMVASDPRFPFGGIKDSGYGRELGAHGLREFTNVKTIRVFPSTPGSVPSAGDGRHVE